MDEQFQCVLKAPIQWATSVLECSASTRGRAFRVVEKLYLEYEFSIYEVGPNLVIFGGKSETPDSFDALIELIHVNLLEVQAPPVQVWACDGTDTVLYFLGTEALNVFSLTDSLNPTGWGEVEEAE